MKTPISTLMARYRRELADFDERPQKYKPRWLKTEIADALLLHREIERLNSARATEADNDAANVVDGGDA